MKMIIDKSKALISIFAGKKVTNDTFSKKTYIHLVKGRIVNNKNKLFDINSSNVNKWTIWKEPKHNKMTNEEAIYAVFEGNKVCNSDMAKGIYISLNDGQMVLNDGTSFNIMDSKNNEWFIFKKKEKNKDEFSNILLKQIEVLTKENTKLKSNTKDGRSAEVQNNTLSLIQDAYGVNEPKDVKNLFKEQLQNAISKRDVQVAIIQFVPYAWIGGRTLGTTSVYYTELRNIVKEVGGKYEDMALSLLVPPSGLYEASQAKVTASVKEKHIERDTYDKDYILNRIALLKEQIDTNNIPKSKQQTQERATAYVYATYLALVTGRRQIEIIKTLKIVKKENDEWFYEGIAKKDEEDTTIKAYSLDEDFEALSKMLIFIQNALGTSELTNKQANSKFNNSFNSAFKRLTETNFTFHDARGIFTDIMFKKSNADDGTWNSEKAFKAELLGHSISKEELSATEHYMTKEAI